MSPVKKTLGISISLVCGLALLNAPAQASIIILGGLSNFDVTNSTGHIQDEFEIELPSIDKSSISSYWANTTSYKGSGYGMPTDYVGASSDNVAGHTSLFVDYKKSGVLTSPGITEHFGIHFKNPYFNPPTTRYAWKYQGVVSDVFVPTITYSSVANANGGVTVRPTVTNTSNATVVVQLHTAPVQHVVELADLVDTNLEIEGIELELEAGDNGLQGAVLEPGQVLGVDGEGHDPTDPIIADAAVRDAWIAAHRAEGLLDVDLDIEGAAALMTLDVFAFDPAMAGGRGAAMVSNFLALNTAAPQTGGQVPEPATFALLGLGLVGIGFGRRTRS